jgi:hypothetical protein
LPSRYALSSDNVAPNATITLGSALAGVAASRVANRNPAQPARSTLASDIFTFTFGGSVDIVGAGIANTNAGGTTAVFGNGSTTRNLAIPANGADGTPRNAGGLFASTLSGSVITCAINTGGPTLAVGEICLFIATYDLNWGKVKLRIRRPHIVHETDGGSLLQYDRKIRQRVYDGRVLAGADAAAVWALEEAANGSIQPWYLFENPDVNDFAMVQFPPGTDLMANFVEGRLAIDISFEAIEMSAGPPLY